jgi:hypothetical protein
MLQLNCPCGAVFTGRNPDALVTQVQTHTSRQHGTRVSAPAILSAARSQPETPPTSQLALRVAEKVAGALAEASGNPRTARLAGLVHQTLKNLGETTTRAEARPGGHPEALSSRSTGDQHRAPVRSGSPKVVTPPPSDGEAVGPDRLAQQKKMRDQADYIRWAEQMQSLQHQTNMGITRNIVP